MNGIWKIGSVLAVACGSLALVHCAAPNLPEDSDLGGDGRAESASPAASAAASPPSTTAPAAPPAASAAPPSSKPTTPTTPAATCNKTLPFAAPSLVAGLATGTDFATPRLSHDELAIYFTMHVNGIARAARATRAAPSAPFGTPQMIDVQSTTAKDNDPSISADGATLWFSSERASANDRLFMATVTPGTTTFGAPQQVAGIAASTGDDEHAYFRVAGGGELWFASTRGGQWDIYVAKKNGAGTFDAPALVSELHSTEASRQPMITEDGLTILFGSERAGGSGGRDLWMATRATATGTFGTPQVIANVSSPANEFAGWLSPDGCRVYFSSDRAVASQHQIYVASRP